MAIVIAATAYSHWQTLLPWLEVVAGVDDGWERGAEWYRQADAVVPDDGQILILHCRPEHAIANAMTLGVAPDEALRQWRDTTAALLAFFRRNRRRTALVEVNSALRQPGKLAEHLASRFDQPLQAREVDFPAMESPALLMRAMAAQMVAQAPEVSALIREAEASTLPLDEETWRTEPVDIAALAIQLEAEKREWERQAKAQAQQMESARQETEVWQQRFLAAEEQANKQFAELAKARDLIRHEAETLGKQLAALREQHEASERTVEGIANARDQARQENETLQKQLVTLNEQQQNSQRSLAETREENELLLLQLHQVQEELESTFLKAQEGSERLKQVEGEHTKLQSELKAEKDRFLGQQQALAAARKEAEANKKALDAAKSEVEANKKALVAAQAQARKQASESTAALDAARQETATWKKKLPEAEAKIKQQLADLTKTRDAAAAEAQTTRRQMMELQDRHTRSERKLADATEENELLLLQLHQVQEELENTFLKAQEDSGKLRETEQNLETANAELTTLQQKVEELEKNPFRRTFAPLKALARPRGKRNSEQRKLQRDIALIQSSGLFNAEWYLQTYPDVAHEGFDPLEHYLRHGAAEGRNPSTDFATEFYLNMYPDVRETAMNPLLHYIKFGREEGRLPKG